MPLITPNKVASFSANKAGVYQPGIPSLTETVITFGTKEFDLGGYYNTSNSRWTPPAGVVLLTAGLRILAINLTVGDVLSMIFRKNGTDLRWNRYIVASTSNEVVLDLSAISSANGTDYYDVALYAGGTGDKQVDGLIGATFFQGSILN